ncbi:MAG: YbjN domain-containing protein [Acidobacteriota bacterium]
MEFAHSHHQTAFEQVRVFLDELFEDAYLNEDNGHTYVRYGSTVLEISVDPYGPEEATVTVMSYCVQDVEVDEELLFGLLELNHSLPVGAFSLVGQDIFFSHSIFGRTVERSNLLGLIAAVANTADEYDDRIVARYGGVTALEKIHETGGRGSRTESRSSS